MNNFFTKKKIVFLVFVAIIFSLFLAKNIIINNILERELSKSLNQNVHIGSTNFGFISKNISINNIYFEGYNLKIGNINTKVPLKEILNSQDIEFENIDIKNIIIAKPTKNNIEPFSSNLQEESEIIPPAPRKNSPSTEKFLKELNKVSAVEKNLSNVFSQLFDKEKITQTLSGSLNKFLINNLDYIDIILEKETNLYLEKDLTELKINYLNGINEFKKLSKMEMPFKIKITNLNFDGSFEDFKFNGTIKNLSNDFKSEIPITISGNFSQFDSKGNFNGNFILSQIKGNFEISSPKIYLTDFPEIKSFLNSGNLTLNIQLNILDENFELLGNNSAFNIALNYPAIKDYFNTSDLNKTIIEYFLKLGEENIKTFELNTKYTTNENYLRISTNLPAEFRSILINNNSKVNDEIGKTIENHYEEKIEKKKESISNFFKNIF